MIEMMLWIFWISTAFVAYTLAGYPLLLWIGASLRTRTTRRAEIEPRISVIVVVHNEAAAIGDKIRNTLDFDYPREKLEIIIGSDGSTDGTVEVVRSFHESNVILVESRERLGKHCLQMMARDASQGEILIFTDATIRAKPDLPRRMVSHFADPTIGCVSTVDEVTGSRSGWMGEHFYVYGEMGLRRMEARMGSVVSMNGSLYAARREICQNWHADMSSDFFMALHCVERGLRAILDPECGVHVGVVRSGRREFVRKVRTIVHGMVVLFAHLHLLNPFRYGLFSWQLASHKLFRWLLPLPFLAILVSSVFLWHVHLFYRVCLMGQAAVYGAGLMAMLIPRLSNLAIFRLASFFCMGNVATLVAWWKSLSGDKMVTWEPSRRA
jgi:glycosyltransferase involved in cell wall biosynthesis